MTEKTLKDLKFDPNNARIHTEKNLSIIEESLHRNGFGRSVLLARDGTIIAGNATVEAAGAAGFDRVIEVESDGRAIIAVRRTDLDPNDEQAISLALADNAAAEHAEWSAVKLKELHDAGHDMEFMWSHDEIKEMFNQADRDSKRREDREKIHILADTALTRNGDIWKIGDHYLMCGDSTNKEDVAKLFSAAGGVKANLLVTSPPYGIGKEYADNSKEDSLNQWRMLMRSWIHVWAPMTALAAVNLADLRVGPNGREVHTYGEMTAFMDQLAMPLIATRIWVKPPAWNMPYYAHSYRPVDDFEYIGLYGDAAYSSRLDADVMWRYRGTWEMSSVSSNDDHPAKFPVELPERCILLLTDPGDVICDPFMGSGTTMIAAEDNGRLCLGMELSPRYVDLALNRFKELNGVEPELVYETDKAA